MLKELWTEENTSEVHNTYQYVFDLRHGLEDTCRLARESLHTVQSSQKHVFDMKTRDRKFNVGDRVLLLLSMEHNKLMIQRQEPHEVQEVVNLMDYKICVKGKTKIYHANLLKLYHERADNAADIMLQPYGGH